jgi:ABC-2 type transport system permease protein
MSGRRAITLVARREIRERLRSRTFLISTLLMLALVGGSAALGQMLNSQKTYRVAVTAPAPPGRDAALQRAAKPFDANVRLRVLRSAAVGRQELTAKHVDALLLLPTDRLVFRANVDTKLAAVADTAVRALRRHLPPAPELTTQTLQPPDAKSTDAATAVAYIGSLLLLTSLAIYGQWVVAGVVEEKNNRVVELILSTVRARHLLAGKVIGIGLLGLAQVALVAGLAATLLAAGVFDAPTMLGGSLALVVPWFALGFALYAVAYAAAGALASRQQDANSAGQTVTYTLLAAYFVGYIALSADTDGILANVLTVFPLTAPLVLPARSALVGVPLWEHALALVLVLGSIYMLVRLAGRVYAQGLLHSGPPRPRLRRDRDSRRHLDPTARPIVARHASVATVEPGSQS